ncbi:LacI family transcriptional regulator [Serinicoccus chungangensis]|uniref:LacI family transcriptional regulator n=1 Tax=Serinicoccus chungangensis TaxID=767452 RepID=A0A0W8I0H6_9MICO|nr:LacI family DNA-binding transcriptional regulator [Serinicoccus chungangensis]KUG51124.1 LacI family transcriptional regulator [Serinicoccus chungangensis]
MTTRPRATDVARRAGVSQTAVSFVMNGLAEGNVSPATRDKILRAAEDLGYEPNEVARSLRSSRTRTLGMVTDAIASSPFAGRIMGGAGERAAADGYAVMTIDTHGHAEREAGALAELVRRRVDGLIYASMGFRVLDRAPAARIPVVLANCTARSEEELSVVPDDAGGARVAAEHLLGLGHRDLAMLSGHYERGADGTVAGNVSGPIRARAFEEAVRSTGAAVKVVPGGWEIRTGYAAALALLDGAPPTSGSAGGGPTAIFATTDRAALGVLLAAAHLGLQVPQDLSVVGFDDQDGLAADVVPALTTVALPHAAMGEVAVDMALEAVGGRLTPRREVLPCPLVQRDSTSAPR